ncbi:MAG: hypothetical protein M1812_003098 [Candelaria pacifica]|nr:MAG: hypothetical protein M1812_003098 [Candelaria pacifica]
MSSPGLDEQILVADEPPIRRLEIREQFERLTAREKLYAHHMARAAWHGTRIILSQVSPEATSIFDFIIELHRACSGRWPSLADQTGVPMGSLRSFLKYAAVFLGNVGNYYGTGDQKFIPRVSDKALKGIASISPRATELYQIIAPHILARRPGSLGYPSDVAQSAYYPGNILLSRQEISLVSKTLEENSIYPENTRVRKSVELGKPTYDVLQASIDLDCTPAELRVSDVRLNVRLVRGDHSKELGHIHNCLGNAKKYAANDLQKRYIEQLQESFKVGNIEPYKESQRIWVRDFAPSVETIFGFVEPYRDPHGMRAEFEGLVAFVDTEETKSLTSLVDSSANFIRRLPWAIGSQENDGKGPFEKNTFEPPDFTSIHTLAYCSSIIFPGINLPNFNDIRQNDGFKNVMVTNRISAEYSKNEIAPAFLAPADAPIFLDHKYHAFYLWVVIHELLGHGTGKMLTQDGPNEYNFDVENPPIDPLTGRRVESWYRPGQTWTGLFGDLATTIDECRAECVGAYLMNDKELLGMFGFDDHTPITADDLAYNLYLQLGVGGLRALENYIVDDRKWGQAHSRAHFAMLRVLLNVGNGFLRVECTKSTSSIIVHVDRNKILDYGRPAIAALLLRLHIYRCTADVGACRRYYEDLTAVEGVFLEWREVVLANKQPRHVFVQANTLLEEDGTASLREYDASAEGMIQSWVERGL